jgi:hypothetical protein
MSLCHAKWPAGLERLTWGGLYFAPASLAALGVLWATAPGWAPWSGRPLPQGVWLTAGYLFGRDMAVLAAFWVVAGLYLKRHRTGEGRVLAGVLAAVYAVAFSLIGMDQVMALEPPFPSSIFAPYFFVTGLYAALAAWTLMAMAHPDRTPARLHDLGRLMVAFCLLSTYLAFGQLLTIWYEDLPHEAHYYVPRIYAGGWRWVGLGLLCSIYVGPLAVLLPRWAKRTPWFLGCLAGLVLVGLWAERWWLVAPAFAPAVRLGLPELAMAAAFLGASGLALEVGQ